jgi:serine/threonine-protein kinase HipA
MVPANEHLTMQLARQVYKINTAENGLIFFKDGSPAYITRRFDIKPGGGKFCKEDFATFAGKTKDTTGLQCR